MSTGGSTQGRDDGRLDSTISVNWDELRCGHSFSSWAWEMICRFVCQEPRGQSLLRVGSIALFGGCRKGIHLLKGTNMPLESTSMRAGVASPQSPILIMFSSCSHLGTFREP